MKTRCPACGSQYSLDALIDHDAARRVFVQILKIDNALAIALIKYLSLHRPEQRELTFARTETLLNQLLPDIKAQRIERARQVFDAPPAAWVWAIQQALDARDNGRLKTPLKNHGYLYEIISKWQPPRAVIESAETPRQQKAMSQTLSGVSALEEMKEH